MAAWAARRATGRSFDQIVAALRKLEGDQTLLVQSGKPVGVFRTHADAPRVLIANSNIVPAWATWEHFHELDRKGLMMYGQMTAGSWIYIGSQGIVQGTYETFVEVGRQHYGGDLAGRWLLTAGLGGMGGAQPLAAVMAGLSCLAVECQASRIEMRLRTGYLDRQANDLDEALALMEQARRERKPVSVGLLGNAAEIYPELVRRGVKPDVVTDQTSAHDPLNGYLPAGWTVADWEARREREPRAVEAAAKHSMAEQVRAMLAFHRMGVPTLGLRQQHSPDGQGGRRRGRLRFSRLRARLYPPAVLPRHRPVPLGGAFGRPEDIYRTDAKVKEIIPDNPHLHKWLDMAREKIKIPGPAGAHLLGRSGRARPARPRLQRDGGEGRAQSAHRHRPRSSRFRLGRLAEPRNRGHEGRLRRRVRLANAQCPAQLRLGRHLGVDASWRRRRHRLSHNMPAWSLSPTARRKRRSAFSACCGTIRRAASCATPTPAIRRAIDCAETTRPRSAGNSRAANVRRGTAQPGAAISRRLGGPLPIAEDSS